MIAIPQELRKSHTIPNDTKEKVLAIIYKHYRDFDPTLATEKLIKHHNYNISVETIRKWMIEANLWIPRRQRLKRAYS
ncbi:hypothetical protein [Candidatus Trichorickettsia mobilis]|uniref:hypothetical protein n=1 Tax=Candidatus Trichorickettsia mobilis TaxID=1346319 RepID=UPI0029318C8F|nr:hypothetical protein [Candidatus Trichorickettsia mobilis]